MNHSTQKSLAIQGMHCTNCALGIERSLRSLGLEDATVSFNSHSVLFSPREEISEEQIRKEIQKLGFQVVNEAMEQKGPATSWWQRLEIRLVVSAIFTIPLLAAMFLPFPILHDPKVQLVLCLPVFLIGLMHFGQSAFRSLRQRYANMDVLIVLGITAAFLYSLIGLVFQLGPDFLFFETSATITTLVLLGNLIEQRSVKRTTSAVEELAAIQPLRARRVISDSNGKRTEEVDCREIQTGDILAVVSGDKVPVDGKIIWGEGTANESMITGESTPVEKQLSDSLIGGTVLVNGSVHVEATAVGNETVLAHMVDLVKQAQSTKPSIQRLGDKVSGVFVPAVIIVALLTLFLSWGVFGVAFSDALLRAIAVLVVACPCAMGLATPTAVAVGIGRAAKSGMLIKGGETLERMAYGKTIIFDKTGTLTEDMIDIERVDFFGEHEDEAKRAIIALEEHSTHPIARSLRKHLAGEPLELLNIQEEKGKGVQGQDQDGNVFRIGGNKLLPESYSTREHDIYLLKNDSVLTGITLRDKVKPKALWAIKTLREKGLRPVLLSGDQLQKCLALGHELGISEVHAEKSPAEKLALVEQMEAKESTIYVGDGINDAAALARAGVGVSMSEATGAAMDSAQIVLLNDTMTKVVEAYDLARATLRTIKQNLFWAFFYNILLIPAAALGFLNPMLAALAMAFSDVVVVFNSLRLRKRTL